MQKVDTNRVDAGTLTAEITIDDQNVKFDLKKVDKTKYEIKLIPRISGVYKVRLFLNDLTVKGSPFIIKVDSYEKLEEFNSSNLGNAAKSIDSSIRTEALKTPDQNELVAGKDFKFSVILIEKNLNEKFKNLILNMELTSTVKLNNHELIDHELENNMDGVFQVSMTPKKAGSYFITFYKDGKKIEGSPYKFEIISKLIKKIIKPNYAQVGIPYILTLDNYDQKHLKFEIYRKVISGDSSSLTSVSRSSSSSSSLSYSSVNYEKIIENKNRLIIKFLPLEPVEHTIDIFDGGKLVKSNSHDNFQFSVIIFK